MKRFLALLSLILSPTIGIAPRQVQAEQAIGGDESKINRVVDDASNWIVLLDEPFETAAALTHCAVSASADSLLRSARKAGKYRFVLTADNPSPAVDGACERTLQFNGGESGTKPLATTCTFRNLAAGQHRLYWLARKLPGAPDLTVTDSSMSFACQEKLLDADGIAQTLTVHNQLGAARKFYLGFKGGLACYSKSDFPFCTFETDAACSFTIPANQTKSIEFSKGCTVSPAIAVDNLPWGPCPTTLGELTLSDGNTDTYDISLVNGFNVAMTLAPGSGQTISAAAATGNHANPGVYPLGCDICTGTENPPVWPGCPGTNYPSECHAGSQFDPTPPCHLSQPSEPSYDLFLTTP
jgi:hypothetical protein